MEKNKQKAVTLVETVVAMTLVVIVSASIFLTCSFSLKKQNQNVIKNFFINEAENIAMCYYSDNPLNALTFLIGSEIEIEEDATSFSIYYTNNFNYSDETNASYKISVNFENTLLISCTSLESGKEIYTYGGLE